MGGASVASRSRHDN